MTQQITITTSADVALKPLLVAAIQNETRLLLHGLNRTRERLASFEQQYSMTSAEFERRFNARELSESLDFIEWTGEIKTLRLLEAQHQALQGAQVN